MHEQPKDIISRFRYNLDAYRVKPKDFIGRYEYKLGAYGIGAAKTALYRPGKTSPVTDDMRGEYTIGKALTPEKAGRPVSDLGTPVFADVLLYEGEDEKNGVQLVSCLVTITQTKNIAKTAVAGRSETDKEYMSDGDYVVKLKGNVTRNFENNYPKAEMKRLLEMLRKNNSLSVQSAYLLQFKIYALTVESYTMSQQSTQNQQGFEITCASDTPLILEQA